MSTSTEIPGKSEETATKEDRGSMKFKREASHSDHSSDGCGRMTKKIRTCCNEHSPSSPSLESLPPEMFCQVLSFIGPTSSSLLSLTQLNRFFHDTMETIGKAMLPRACAHFRTPFPSKSAIESSTSLFVRHARACSRVLDQLKELRRLLMTSERDISNDNVKRAMELALNLLEVGPSLSPSLEHQVLSTCGKLGGRAFKYCKARLLRSLGERTSDDVSPPTLRRRNDELTKNEECLDMSRLIMQIVVCRDWQLSKKTPIRSLLNKKIRELDGKAPPNWV